MLWFYCDSDVAAMPSFDDVEELLNASGILDDPVTIDSEADNVGVHVPGMFLSC